MPLECAVVGAGLAGLGAAVALRRAGHDVEVFERSQFKQEVGAAITMTPNAQTILRRWGFEAQSAGATQKCQWKDLDPETLECRIRVQTSGLEDKFGSEVYSYHRLDLHNALRELVTSQQSNGMVPSIRLGREVVGVDSETGVVTLQGGEQLKKDLVVIADGFKSDLAGDVAGLSGTLVRNNMSVYRTLIPIERLQADPLVNQIFKDEPPTHHTAMNTKTHVLWVCYPCRNNTVMNVAVFHPTREDQKDKLDWNSPASVKDVVDQLNKGGFHPAWEAFIRHADEMKCYTVGVRALPPTMAKGKVVAIGDAAHSMLPTHAQGGSMGLEDAAALEVFFAPEHFDPLQDSVEKRVQLWNQFRRPRVTVTQLLSNASTYRVSVEEALKQVRCFYAAPLPAANATMWGPQFQDFFYGYNVFVEAEKAMKYKDTEGGIPSGVIEHFGLKAETNGTDGSWIREGANPFHDRSNGVDGPEALGNW